ncbi:MAG: hypothetical protein HOP16_20590 [Acidobacteria bacterium]|nr:hypothetical protein [Acidobacteriota bacterium]
MTRTGPTTTALTVSYAVTGTATSVDYTPALSGTIVLPIGAASATLTITPVSDMVVEGPETIIVTITTSSTGYMGGGNQATVTIADVSTVFPPLSGPSRTFVFDHAASSVQEYTANSRFVLYDNGAFALRYMSLGGLTFSGRYSNANGAITFEWEDSSAWGATGTLDDVGLTVQYNAHMLAIDFEDAVYVLP